VRTRGQAGDPGRNLAASRGKEGSVARINVEQKALSDPRYSVLGTLLGTSRHEALGLMIVVWNECQERESYYLSGAILNGIFSRENAGHVLSKSELARDTETKGYYICGSKGRIEWLRKRRKEGRLGGKLGGRPKKPLGVRVGVDGKQRPETPPAPAPAPALKKKTASRISQPVGSATGSPGDSVPTPEPTKTDTFTLRAELEKQVRAEGLYGEEAKAEAHRRFKARVQP
jgi:hypothetical protein